MSSESGITLLETVGVRRGRAPLWPLHVERLRKSAAALGLALPASIPKPGGGGDHIVRYAIAQGKVYVSGRSLELLPAVRLRMSSVMHTGYAHKIDHRNWLDDARVVAVQQGADDAVLCDAKGRVVEASIFSVGWWDEGGLVFPALTLGGLPSVARRRISELTKLREVKVGPAEIAGKALIACNAVRGIVAVSALDGAAVPTDPRTAELAGVFWDRPDA